MASSPPDPQASALASSDWLQGLRARPPQRPLRPLQLAWLGDAIWELHQRLHHCQLPAQSKDLHQAVVAWVRADAQARLLQRLEPVLRPMELDLVRRARNQAGPGPRRGEASSYGQATGFEALLGWLFLHDPARLVELLDHLKEIDP